MWLIFGFFMLGGSFLVASHFPPWTAFQQEVVAAAGVTLAGIATLAHQGKWAWPRSAMAALLLATIPLLQAAFGLLVFTADGVMSCLYLLGLALCIALGATLFDRHRELFIDGLFGVLLAASLLSAGLAFCQLSRFRCHPST